MADAPGTDGHALTDDELQAATLTVAGKSRRDVAAEMKISVSGVQHLVTRPHVQAWIVSARKDLARAALDSLLRLVPAAVGTLAKAMDPKSPWPTRMDGAKTVLKFALPAEVDVQVQHSGTVNSIMTQATDNQLLAVLKKLGVEVDD